MSLYLKRLIGVFFFLILFSLVGSQSEVKAACWQFTQPQLECEDVDPGIPPESCANYNPTIEHPLYGTLRSHGQVVYSCANYQRCFDLTDGANSWGCYQHYFVCDTTCGGGGGGGGSDSCGRSSSPSWHTHDGSTHPHWSCGGACPNCDNCNSGNYNPDGDTLDEMYPCRCAGDHQCTVACDLATGPTFVSVTPLSAISARLNWTPEPGAARQHLYIGSDPAKVAGNCPDGVGPGTGCVVRRQGSTNGLPNSQTSFSTGNILTAGTVYYYRIVSFDSSSCNFSSTVNALSSCSLSPSSLSLLPGQGEAVTASVNSSPLISRVEFSSTNNSVATVSPASDNTYTYSTTVSGVAQGSATISARVISTSGATLCQTGVTTGSTTTTATVTPSDPWWQVTDGDVQSMGDLRSDVPDGNYLGLSGAGGFPGIPAYTGTTNLTNTNVSTFGWISRSPWTTDKVWDYAYFKELIPETVLTNITANPVPSSVPGSYFQGSTNGYLYEGYRWFYYNGSSGTDLTINSAMALSNSKVILFVENSDVLIEGNINLADGAGFFGMFVNGNIQLNPASVTTLEGIYLSDGAFRTGIGTSALNVRGAVAAYGGVTLGRDLANNTNPAEHFTYAPDQAILFPSHLSERLIRWKEVAP